MTSKSDPRGHPGLKLCVHVSVMGCYRFTNFRRNRRGSGSNWHFLGWFHMEWPICEPPDGMVCGRRHCGPGQMKSVGGENRPDLWVRQTFAFNYVQVTKWWWRLSNQEMQCSYNRDSMFRETMPDVTSLCLGPSRRHGAISDPKLRPTAPTRPWAKAHTDTASPAAGCNNQHQTRSCSASAARGPCSGCWRCYFQCLPLGVVQQRSYRCDDTATVTPISLFTPLGDLPAPSSDPPVHGRGVICSCRSISGPSAALTLTQWRFSGRRRRRQIQVNCDGRSRRLPPPVVSAAMVQLQPGYYWVNRHPVQRGHLSPPPSWRLKVRPETDSVHGSSEGHAMLKRNDKYHSIASEVPIPKM